MGCSVYILSSYAAGQDASIPTVLTLPNPMPVVCFQVDVARSLYQKSPANDTKAILLNYCSFYSNSSLNQQVRVSVQCIKSSHSRHTDLNIHLSFLMGVVIGLLPRLGVHGDAQRDGGQRLRQDVQRTVGELPAQGRSGGRAPSVQWQRWRVGAGPGNAIHGSSPLHAAHPTLIHGDTG